MIFQDPLSSLHPFYKVGTQLVEAMQAHRDISKAAARERAVELLGMVGIPDPRQRVDAYPHELSGGMRQRAMIAMALSNEPKLLIADEPTTALDVTVQAQILAADRAPAARARHGGGADHARPRRGRRGHRRDRRDVRRAGSSSMPRRETIFRAPEHPYTWGLLRSIPRLDRPRDEPLVPIAGPAAEPDHASRAAARSIRAARTCASAHRRVEPAARAARPTTPRTASRACSTARRAQAASGASCARARSPKQARRGRQARGGAGMTARRAAGRGPRPRQALPAHARDRLPAEGRRGARRRRRLVRRAARRDARHRRRDGMRQDDHGAPDHAPARADRAARSASRARTSRTLRRRALKPLRREMQMIFQDPYSSLNPRKTSARSSASRSRSTGWRRARAGAGARCRS